MNGRDRANLILALLAEWAVAEYLELDPGDLPPSADRARHNEWRDGGVDLVDKDGTRIDVKASRPRYPELMIPLSQRPKFAKPTCPVDLFVKTVVEGPNVTLTCWEDRLMFLHTAHVDDGDRYVIPTMWLRPDEAHPMGVTIVVPAYVGLGVDRFVTEDVPTLPWAGWLTL